MLTLNLKREGKGRYVAKNKNITITIENPKVSVGVGANEWQIVITDSRKAEDFEQQNEWFATKESAVSFAVIWIVRNREFNNKTN